MSARARLALLTLVLLALFVVFGVSGSISRADVRGIIEPLGGWGAPVYVVVAALLGCLLVPGPLLAAVSGVLFGTWAGFAVTLASAVLAALVGMAIGHAAGGRGARELGGERMAAVRAWVARRGLWAVIVQRLLPGIPDAPVNYAAGLAGVRAWHLAAGTAIGVAPRALAYPALGDAIGDRSTTQTLASLALLGATAIAGLVLARRALTAS